MGLLAAIANRFRLKGADIGGWNVLPSQSGKPFSLINQSFGFLQSFRSKYSNGMSQQELMRRYTSWVYACVNKNAINCAQIPLRLYVNKQTGKKSLFPTNKVDNKTAEYLRKSPTVNKFMSSSSNIEEVTGHPFLELMRTVNEFMNGFELIEMTVSHLELTGNSYWFILKNNLGVPTEIWSLYPQYMRPIVSESNFINGYVFSVDGNKKVLLDADQVIHFKYPNPKSPILGMGKIEACVLAADLHTNMNIYETAMFENNAMPDFAFVSPADAGSPDDTQIKRIKSQFRKQFGGVGKTGGMSVIHGGAKVERISMTPKEMAYKDGRKFTLEEIAGVFGVPLSKLTVDNVNRANADAGNYTYLSDTILPILRRIEQKINERLMPSYDDRLLAIFDNPVPEDKEFRLKERESNLKTGYSSINQERQIDNQEPVDWGEEPIMPMGMATLNSQSVIIPEPAKQVKNTKANVAPLQHATNFINQPLTRSLANFFQRQKKEILSKLDDTMPKAVKIDASAGDMVSGWFDVNKWNKEIDDAVFPYIRATFLSGGERAIEQVVQGLKLDENAPGAIGAMEARRGRLVDINATSSKLVRNQVAAGISEGESAVLIRNRINNLFDDSFTKYRAAKISRTETIWAHNAGAVEGYKQSGVVSRKEWSTAKDDRLCEFCAPMDGKIVAIGEHFFDLGSSQEGGEGGVLQFTYEDIDHPPLHPQCRCAIVPVID